MVTEVSSTESCSSPAATAIGSILHFRQNNRYSERMHKVGFA